MTMFLLGFLACYPVSAAANALAFWWEKRMWSRHQSPEVLKRVSGMSWPEIVDMLAGKETRFTVVREGSFDSMRWGETVVE